MSKQAVYLLSEMKGKVYWRKIAYAFAAECPDQFCEYVTRELINTPRWIDEAVNHQSKVGCIKIHRENTRSSLKEAKEWADAHWRGGQ